MSNDKELGGQSNSVNEQAVMACSYVIEEDDDKKETPTPAEGIPMLTRTMSNLSFAADDSRVEILAESLIET